ncbi:MAG: Stp1/IreP family PP2C-type Ser/Thr phosphatase [Armatimonadota bacterium]
MAQDTEITAKLDTGDLAEAWAKKKGLKPKLYLDTKVGARTDLGLIRENNEDKFDFFEPEELEILALKGCLYAVADGMGGHASGQIASELALKTIIKTYYGDTGEDVGASLKESFNRANSYIYDAAQMVKERNGMGTTCTALVLRDDQMFLAHVGDSRLYLIREGSIRRVSEDHSWVAEQVKRGALTEEEAHMSPFRNVITRSLGAAPDVETDISVEPILKSDIFVLCSDGLSGYVRDEEILDLVTNWSPAVAALKLIDRANENGGGDNITAVIISVRDIQKGGGCGPLQRLLGRS